MLDPDDPINAEIVACWLLNEGMGTRAADLSHGNHGTLSAGVEWAGSDRGPLVRFAASTHVIAIPPAAQYSEPAEFSLAMRLRLDADVTGNWRAALRWPTGDTYWMIYGDTANEGFFTYRSDGVVRWLAYSPFGAGVWRSIVVTVKAGEQRTYRNGALAASYSFATAITTATGAINIGQSGSANMRGLVDYLRLYRRILTADEARRLHIEPYAGVQEESTRRFYSFTRPNQVRPRIVVSGARRPDPAAKPPWGAQPDRADPLNRDLVLCYLFNEAASLRCHDISGWPESGTITHGSVQNDTLALLATRQAGPTGPLVRLNGLNQYVHIFHSARLRFDGTRPLSIVCRVLTHATEATTGYVLSKPWNGFGQYNYFLQRAAGGEITFAMHGSTDVGGLATRAVVVAGANALPLGQWRTLAMTLDTDQTLTVYVNGVQTHTSVGTLHSVIPPAGDSSLPLAIGTLYPYGTPWAGDTTQALDGSFDWVRIYQRILTPGEVMRLHREPYSDMIPPSVQPEQETYVRRARTGAGALL